MKPLKYVNSRLHLFMAVPALVLFGVFFLYPLSKGIGMSLTDWDGMSPAHFVGIQNFIDFFHDKRAVHDILNTVLFAAGSAPLLILFGLTYALILDGNFRGKGVARAIVYLPAVISPLIMGYIWYFLLQPGRGYFYEFAQRLGTTFFLGNWMLDYKAAIAVLVAVNVWQYVGMTMVVFLAGLQSIPQDIYEMSQIDGAGYMKRLTHITLPLLMPSIKINVVTNIIGSLSVFDIIMAMTEGGPGYATESLSIYIMRMCYGAKTGYSTAVALILFFIILVPVVLYMRLSRAKEVDFL